MNESITKNRYALSRKAYINRKELGQLLMIDSKKMIEKIWISLRIDIQDYLKTINKELIDEKMLPTNLVFKFLDNQNLLKQIEKDYAQITQK